MPIYEYECRDCGKRTELLQRMADAPLATCPECGGPVRKLISSPAFQFKGSGWYATDYAVKKGGGGAETKPEDKPEGKAEKKEEKKEKKEAVSESKSSSGSGSSGSSDS